MKNIGFEFNRYNWVLPDYIYVSNKINENGYHHGVISKKDFLLSNCQNDFKKIPNKHFRIKIDPLINYPCSYWQKRIMITRGGLSIIDDNGERYSMYYSHQNLLQLIQFCGLTEDGILNGFFKLSEVDETGYFKFIPEGTREEIWKSKISKIYNDKSIHFSKKMIPGHIYISRTKKLFLCLGTDLDFYGDVKEKWGGLWTLMNSYGKITKRKAKILIYLTPDEKERLERQNIKTVREIFEKKCGNGYIYSNEYSGKDLGEYILPNTWDEIIPIFEKEISNIQYCFIDNIYKTNTKIKNNLKEYIEENYGHYLSNYLSTNPKLDGLIKELGIQI